MNPIAMITGANRPAQVQPHRVVLEILSTNWPQVFNKHSSTSTTRGKLQQKIVSQLAFIPNSAALRHQSGCCHASN
jgi:hypothetical protein